MAGSEPMPVMGVLVKLPAIYDSVHLISSHLISSHLISSHHITSHHIASRHITSHCSTVHHVTVQYITLCCMIFLMSLAQVSGRLSPTGVCYITSGQLWLGLCMTGTLLGLEAGSAAQVSDVQGNVSVSVSVTVSVGVGLCTTEVFLQNWGLMDGGEAIL